MTKLSLDEALDFVLRTSMANQPARLSAALLLSVATMAAVKYASATPARDFVWIMALAEVEAWQLVCVWLLLVQLATAPFVMAAEIFGFGVPKAYRIAARELRRAFKANEISEAAFKAKQIELLTQLIRSEGKADRGPAVAA